METVGRSSESRAHWVHSGFWFGATIVLAAALVGLGSWVLIDRRADQTRGLASADVVTMLEGRIAAWTQGDLQAAAAVYEENGTLEEMDQSPSIVTQGRVSIARRLQQLYAMGLRLKPAGALIQVDNWVAEPVIYYTPDPAEGTSSGILVFKIGPSGKIEYQWAL